MKVLTILSLFLFVICDSVQAFVVIGGRAGSFVLTLLPGARAWTPLARLPRRISGLQASIVRGRLRVTGGNIDSFPSSMVKFENGKQHHSYGCSF